MAIVVKFVGGPQHGRSVRSDSVEELEAKLARTIWYATGGGTVGNVSDYHSYYAQPLEDLPEMIVPMCRHRVVSRCEVNGDIVITVEYEKTRPVSELLETPLSE